MNTISVGYRRCSGYECLCPGAFCNGENHADASGMTSGRATIFLGATSGPTSRHGLDLRLSYRPAGEISSNREFLVLAKCENVRIRLVISKQYPTLPVSIAHERLNNQEHQIQTRNSCSSRCCSLCRGPVVAACRALGNTCATRSSTGAAVFAADAPSRLLPGRPPGAPLHQ